MAEASRGGGHSAERQVVAFRLQDEEFGIPIHQVREIIKVPDITFLPHSSPHIEGVINLRGDVLPVVNLRVRFGLPAVERSESTRIIVVELPFGEVGLVVDAVSEVLRIPEDAIGRPPHLQGLRTEWLDAIGKLGNRLLLLLNLESLLSNQDDVSFAEVAAATSAAKAEETRS